jgi:ribosomal protein S18 acetylase RimI-like enzyme
MSTRQTSRAAQHIHAIVRDMRRDDLNAVADLDARAYGEPRRAYFERRLAALDRGDLASQNIFLIAEAGGNGAIVGFVMGTLTSGEFGFTEVTALVDSIAVQPGWRRRGVGRQLASAFVAESARRGARDVYTLVNWSSWDILRFFDAMGFCLAQTAPLRRRIGEAQAEAKAGERQ